MHTPTIFISMSYLSTTPLGSFGAYHERVNCKNKQKEHGINTNSRKQTKTGQDSIQTFQVKTRKFLTSLVTLSVVTFKGPPRLSAVTELKIKKLTISLFFSVYQISFYFKFTSLTVFVSHSLCDRTATFRCTTNFCTCTDLKSNH